MHDIWLQVLAAWEAQTQLEIVAVVTGILYLVLAIRQNIWCWFFAFISTGLYIYLFHSVSLMSESILNIYYLIMAVYGWHQWRDGNYFCQRKIVSWPLKKHLMLILIAGLCVPILGYVTSQYGAAMPYLDAFTTCFAVLTTVLVAHKVLQNWHYWMVINSVSVYLFFSKELYLTALMFCLYLVLAIFGWLNWNKSYGEQKQMA